MPDTQISEEMVDAFIATFNSGVFDKAPFGMPIDERCRCKKCLQEEADARSTVRAALEAALSGHVVAPKADYLRLLQLVELDDMLVICETCGAWLDRDDPATATTDDYNGCWKVAAGEDSDRCKSYRAMIQAAPPVQEMEG